MKNADTVIQNLTEDTYTRERLEPRPGDILYLHLRDLRTALEAVQTEAPLRVLDYGCGSSPYRSLFPKSHYERADFLDVGTLDYPLGVDSRVPEIDAQFDLVLSTQVLEHVPEPQVYLSECLRLLKPGGKLFLTTHGVYEEHGCPQDFHRWTADGLDRALSNAGFQNLRIQKLTTGPRAVLFLMGTSLNGFYSRRRTVARVLFNCYWRLFHRFRARIHAMADAEFPDHRVVSVTESGHILYIGLAAQAQRPG